jgi:Outer membrane protein beta-barrel domain
MRQDGWLRTVCVAAWLTAASGAHGQVKDEDVRLYLDGSLFSKRTWSGDAGGGAAYTSGVLMSGGVGGGYVLNPYLLAGLYAWASGVRLSEDDGTWRDWELTPNLEVPLAPHLRFVPFLMAGMTLRRTVTNEGDGERKMFGPGVALGAGGHAFLTARASLDLSLALHGTWYALDDAAPDDTSVASILVVNLGASFWL